MATTSPGQSFPVPTSSDDPDIPADLMTLATAIEKRVVGVYNNSTDRAARVTAPQEGQVAYMKDSDTFVFYNGTTWTAMFPAQVSITNGTVVPNNSTGNNGDIFFKTA